MALKGQRNNYSKRPADIGRHAASVSVQREIKDVTKGVRKGVRARKTDPDNWGKSRFIEMLP